MLIKFRDVELYLNIQKCFFHVQEIAFSDVILSTKNFRINFNKVETIINQKIFNNLK